MATLLDSYVSRVLLAIPAAIRDETAEMPRLPRIRKYRIGSWPHGAGARLKRRRVKQ
jgi:hypothetical protein